MTDEKAVMGKRRRTAAEIEQIANEFAGSGLNRSQFCRRQGLTLGTLNRYLMRLRSQSSGGATSGGLVPVELAVKLGTDHRSGCGLAVVVASGRRIEVSAGFDGLTLQRLVQVLERL
jgi:hypothetical protein